MILPMRTKISYQIVLHSVELSVVYIQLCCREAPWLDLLSQLLSD